MSNDHKKLSRYDLERIFGEAIQLHFNSWDGCAAWIGERMAMTKRCSEDDLSFRELKIADELMELVRDFSNVSKSVYDFGFTHDEVLRKRGVLDEGLEIKQKKGAPERVRPES